MYGVLNISTLSKMIHVLCVILLAGLAVGDEEIDLTLEVAPAVSECFYHRIPKETAYEVDVQVIEGGDLDISLLVQDPFKKTMVYAVKKTETFHQLNSGTAEGDYTFCLDNMFSRFSPKLVNLQIIIEKDDDDDDLKADYDFEGTYSTKLEDFKNAIHTTKKNLDSSLQTLNYLKTVEARDRSIAEDNFERVNFWSFVQVTIMIITALTQVFLIRSLFEDNSRMAKLFKQST